ncbi:isoprenoid synthase domain-containing protein [Lactarius hengduanensis]|nr:isoprenoid synthase domain-containing protein [Lactarius hengduanensis]
MADFAHRAALSPVPLTLETVEEYDLYCHYVAGLVGEGLSRLFSATGKESESLSQQLELSNSVGLLLQKTNIIRDFREDADDGRFFWPREIWGSTEYTADGHTPSTDIRELLRDPRRAAWVQSAMVVDALRHACDALDYLRLLRNQSIFNFVAIPATMALATLDLCFMNPQMFERNIKIRKAKAAEVLVNIFKEHARSIHAKASPADPNYLRVSVACAKIEHWAERNYPSFIRVLPSTYGTSPGISFDPSDARSRIAHADAETDRRAADEKRLLGIRERIAAGGSPSTSLSSNQGPPWEVLGVVGGAVFLVLGLSLGIVYLVLYFFT